jgi:GNAT superfamily N-acetyltransferase
MLGNTIVPSKNQLPPGKAMWAAWKKSGDAQHLMRESASEREIAQVQYMQGECAVLALTIHKMNPQRFPLAFVYEFFDSSPDMYIEPDEFDELDPARQQDIQYSYQNWTLTHAYVYDVLTREYIDAEGRHKQLPMIGRDLNATRHNKFPAETQDLVNVSHHMEWDEAQEKWIVLQGWAALDKAYTPEDKQRAREYAIKYLGIDPPAQAVAEDSEHYNGIELSMEIEKDDEYVDDDDYDNQTLYVRATSGGRELGHVLFAFDGEYLMPQDLEVEEKYRGQGIAQIMYDYVKSKGYKIRRSGQQTDAGAGFWGKHRPEQNVWENFHDGRNPQDKGDSKRHGVPTKASISTLRKVAKQGGRKGQLAHWMANMKSGRAKAKK